MCYGYMAESTCFSFQLNIVYASHKANNQWKDFKLVIYIFIFIVRPIGLPPLDVANIGSIISINRIYALQLIA